MATGLFTDAAERFVLGTRNGIVTPTTEPVSDTAVTPFGLTRRTVPTRTVVCLRSPDGVLIMAGTEKVTTYEKDGNEDSSSTEADYVSD